MKFLCAVLCLVSTLVAADPLSDKWQKRVDTAAANHSAALKKADDARFSAVQRANKELENALKKVLADSVKLKDFEAAAILKEKVAAAEKDGSGRSMTTKSVKFGGHEYAFINEKATWHVAQRRCTDMGGHLAIVDNKNEAAFIADLTKQSNQNKEAAWVGATDEEIEGQWMWVNGKPVDDFLLKDAMFDNSGEEGQHYLCYLINHWDDAGNSRRSFICEWEN